VFEAFVVKRLAVGITISIMHGFDAETEALRRELAQLPQRDLLALAQQEGVRVSGLGGAEIIEALLRMGSDDAAGEQPLQPPLMSMSVSQLLLSPTC
jgi:hypothetical protein